jgi:hypothetical protein
VGRRDPALPQSDCQVELEALFLVHAVLKYPRKEGVLDHVRPRYIFSTGQRDRFRPEAYNADCAIKGYWNLEENGFGAAVLRSYKVSSAVKPFQSRALMGERDFPAKILELPIPQFDKGNPIHRRLAVLGA